LDLDLTIDLIHFIAQQYKNFKLTSLFGEKRCQWKALSSFILEIFSNFSATPR